MSMEAINIYTQHIKSGYVANWCIESLKDLHYFAVNVNLKRLELDFTDNSLCFKKRMEDAIPEGMVINGLLFSYKPIATVAHDLPFFKLHQHMVECSTSLRMYNDFLDTDVLGKILTYYAENNDLNIVEDNLIGNKKFMYNSSVAQKVFEVLMTKNSIEAFELAQKILNSNFFQVNCDY